MFFDLNTILENLPLVKEFMYSIDGAKYLDEEGFISNKGVTLSRVCLSTGCKTVLNILLNPDRCFDTLGCGSNAMFECLKVQNGIILWRGDFYKSEYEATCDILYRGRNLHSIRDFITCYYNGRSGYNM